jgi:nitroreductase
MEFSDLARARRSVKSYDPAHAVTDAELRALFELVALTPTSFNLQHQRFVVVRDPARKRALRAAAMNQPQVESASAAVVVLGKLDAHAGRGERIENYYAGKPALARDEAIRSASLAAMTLMYAALDAGYASGPMIGFDPDAVARVIELPPGYVPVMLVVIGKPAGEPRPRADRLPLSESVRLETFAAPLA